MTASTRVTAAAAAAPPPADRWEQPVPRLAWGALFLLGYVGWSALYFAINEGTAGRSVAQPLLPGEAGLPRLTWLYPAYALVYVQVWLPLLLAPTRRRFVTIQVAFALASLVGFTVFLLAPMAYPRPPLEVAGVFDQLLAWEYGSDGPRCTFPSLHVSYAWTLWLAHRGRSRSWALGLLASAIAVSLATVFLKQHFIVDVPAGMALAWASWWAAPRVTARLTGTARG